MCVFKGDSLQRDRAGGEVAFETVFGLHDGAFPGRFRGCGSCRGPRLAGESRDNRGSEGGEVEGDGVHFRGARGGRAIGGEGRSSETSGTALRLSAALGSGTGQATQGEISEDPELIHRECEDSVDNRSEQWSPRRWWGSG